MPVTRCQTSGRRRTDHAAMLFMLNCYDVWSATPPGPCCVAASFEIETEQATETSRCH